MLGRSRWDKDMYVIYVDLNFVVGIYDSYSWLVEYLPTKILQYGFFMFYFR